jgi:hypothetical protein
MSTILYHMLNIKLYISNLFTTKIFLVLVILSGLIYNTFGGNEYNNTIYSASNDRNEELLAHPYPYPDCLKNANYIKNYFKPLENSSRLFYAGSFGHADSAVMANFACRSRCPLVRNHIL